MNKVFTLLILIIGTFTSVVAQNIDWEARVNNVRSIEGGAFSGSSCYEAGEEEYTSLFAVKDNIMGSFSSRVCVTCNRNGDCEYGGGTGIASNLNVNASTLQVWFQGFEDDGGERCTKDGSDDCNCENDNLASINIRSGSVCEWVNYGDYGCGSHDRIRIGLRWRYSTAQFSTHPSNQSVCDGTNATFSAALNSNYNGGVTYQWQYFNGSSWVNQGGASTTYSNLVIGAISSINGRQYRLQVYQCNYDGETRYTYSNPATLTVNTLSTAATSIMGITQKCDAGTSTFSISGGSLGTSASWKWFSGGCGTTSVGTGNSINYSLPVGTTVLYARAEGTCNTTVCVNKNIVVNQPSSPMTSATYSPAVICAGSNVSVTANGGTLGTNSTWRWYSDAGLNSQIASGNPANINPQIHPTVYVAALDATGICPVSSAYSVNLSGVTIHTPSTNPSSTNYSSTSAFECSNNPVSVTVNGGSLGNGAQWVLYDKNPSNPSATVITSSTSTTFDFTPSETGSYWVRAENLCINTSAVEVKVIVNSSNSIDGSLTSTNSNSTCVVNDNSWHVFRNANNEIIGAINSYGQNLGNVTVSTTVGSDGPYGTGGPKCNGVEEYFIPRKVNITPQYAASSDVGIRLFFNQSEYNAHQSTTNGQTNFYKYCYGLTESPFDLTVSALNSSGLPDSIGSINKVLKSGSTDIYQFEFDLYNLPANGTYTGGKLGSSGVDFYIHNSGGLYSVLPIELVSFTGKYVDMNVLLDWLTASEINNSHFDIERSENGIDFKTIASINGNGTTSSPSNYQFIDYQSNLGTQYFYRLKQIDFDGGVNYSNIIQVNTPFISGVHVGLVYPNPADKEAQFRIYSDQNLQDLKYRLYDASGKLVFENQLKVSKGDNQYQINIAQLPIGAYQIVLSSSTLEKAMPLIIAR
ncbi:MAG TPA: T9SS type A sorting domain-containing protein [Chitinophagales bacterium]|nr:T9SS type A sorting domain-containing protein [Chitinophagales bacterium]